MTVETASTAPPGEPATAPRLSDVRTDMAGLFGGMPAVPPGEPMASVHHFRSLGRRRLSLSGRVSRVPIALGALAAGLLIGVALHGRLPLFGGPAAVIPSAHGAPATGVAENPFERASDAVPAKPAVAPPAAQPRLALIDTAAKREPAAVVPAKAAAPAVTAKPRRAAIEGPRRCEGDRLERAWCMRPDILKADRRLRRAYAEAIRQGVERRFLIDHQRRWARLRNRAARDPAGVLEGYDELAAALERLSVNGRAANRI